MKKGQLSLALSFYIVGLFAFVCGREAKGVGKTVVFPCRRAGEKRNFARPEALGAEAGSRNFSAEKYA